MFERLFIEGVYGDNLPTAHQRVKAEREKYRMERKLIAEMFFIWDNDGKGPIGLAPELALAMDYVHRIQKLDSELRDL